jgi:hypothetical protein
VREEKSGVILKKLDLCVLFARMFFEASKQASNRRRSTNFCAIAPDKMITVSFKN